MESSKNNSELREIILEEINKSIWIKLSDTSINELCYKKINPESMGQYKILDFLKILKLEKLFKLNKITEEEYINLNQIIELKNNLSKMIKEEIFHPSHKMNNDKITFLEEQYIELDRTLENYNLSDNNIFDLEKILELIAKNEQNNKSDNKLNEVQEKVKRRVKEANN